MKAFILHDDEDVKLKNLKRKLKARGSFNCNFETFKRIYYEWHEITLPETSTSAFSIKYADYLFESLMEFMKDYDISETEVKKNVTKNKISDIYGRLLSRSNRRYGKVL